MTVKTETETVALTVKVVVGRVERVGRGGVVKEVAGAAAANSNMRISPIRRRYVYHIKSRLSIVSYMRYTCDTLLRLSLYTYFCQHVILQSMFLVR